MELLCIDNDLMSKYYKCRACDYESDPEHHSRIHWTCIENVWKRHHAKLGIFKGKSIKQWIGASTIQRAEKKCPTCHTSMQKVFHYDSPPSFVAFIVDKTKVNVDN